MSSKHFQVLVLLAFFAFVLTGCDTGRGAMYKVRFTTPVTVADPARTQPTDAEQLKKVIRASLVGKGFKELQGAAHRPGVWNRKGAWVELERDKDGELFLIVRAFGSRKDVRVSEQTEQELVSILKGLPGLELTPTD